MNLIKININIHSPGLFVATVVATVDGALLFWMKFRNFVASIARRDAGLR